MKNGSLKPILGNVFDGSHLNSLVGLGENMVLYRVFVFDGSRLTSVIGLSEKGFPSSVVRLSKNMVPYRL